MSKQINQYDKTRTSGTVKDDDYLDLDSTEDSGSTFESAKMTMLNLVNYLKEKIPSFYITDEALTGNRRVTSSTFWAKFWGGDVIVEMNDGVNDYGFLIQDDSSVEKARLGYDQATASAVLKLINSGGLWFDANNGVFKINTNSLYVESGFVGIGTSVQDASEVLRVNGPLLVTTHLIDSARMVIKAGANTNTVNFSVENNADGVYFTITGDAGEGRVGIGTGSPNAKAILDLSTTTRGFLQPRMTTVQRDAILTPPESLQVYNLTTSKMNFYNGSAWEEITSS